jgi:hypothetical protein
MVPFRQEAIRGLTRALEICTNKGLTEHQSRPGYGTGSGIDYATYVGPWVHSTNHRLLAV